MVPYHITANMLTHNATVSRRSNAPDAGKALVSGRVQVDRIGTRDRCRRGRKGPESRALPASRADCMANISLGRERIDL